MGSEFFAGFGSFGDSYKGWTKVLEEVLRSSVPLRLLVGFVKGFWGSGLRAHFRYWGGGGVKSPHGATQGVLIAECSVVETSAPKP